MKGTVVELKKHSGHFEINWNGININNIIKNNIILRL